MKRLANLKNVSSNSPHSTSKKHSHHLSDKKNTISNPYPESGYVDGHSSGSPPYGRRSTTTAASHNDGSFMSYEDPSTTSHVVMRSNRSTAPTLATNPDTIGSDAGRSRAETSGTAGGALSSRDGYGNSTFSSPQHSQESLTTTLTTIQSTAPSGMLAPPNGPAHGSSSMQFSHQYPVSPPVSAIPSHLAPQHPHSYQAATANNMLSDNASILTLASSSKRRRRRSLDTDASVRAIAPASLFGNSRESLPLSVLSANVETANGIYGGHNRPSVSGIAGAERASLYSASGVPALSSERNSYVAEKRTVDGASVRSGLLGHGRSESGSITGIASSPLVSPRDVNPPRRSSRMSTEWKEQTDCASEVSPADDNGLPSAREPHTKADNA